MILLLPELFDQLATLRKGIKMIVARPE